MTSDTAVCVRAIPDVKCAYNSSHTAIVIGTLCHLWSVIIAAYLTTEIFRELCFVH